KIDFLSIDVEGTELDVLRGLNLGKYRPRLILLEDRLVYLNKHRWLKSKGYKLVKRTGFNNWYIPKNEHFGLSSRKEKFGIFKKLYLGLLIRKIKESLKMKNLKPLKEI
ncbi:MAG: FkbM family methyltransferase, partial [Planctomycetes bacterium]|nr:FkbM family methyltransferase [Planctomycetota bacterium]